MTRGDPATARALASIARLAGVRQSHVTYYFPHRPDLIAALAAAAVGDLVVTRDPDESASRALQRLVERIGAPEHMRMHVGLMIEADRDPAVRAILRDATRPMLDALGRLQGVNGTPARTQATLAALWGFGLYRFMLGSQARTADVSRALVALLAGPAADGAVPVARRRAAAVTR